MTENNSDKSPQQSDEGHKETLPLPKQLPVFRKEKKIVALYYADPAGFRLKEYEHQGQNYQSLRIGAIIFNTDEVKDWEAKITSIIGYSPEISEVESTEDKRGSTFQLIQEVIAALYKLADENNVLLILEGMTEHPKMIGWLNDHITELRFDDYHHHREGEDEGPMVSDKDMLEALGEQYQAFMKEEAQHQEEEEVKGEMVTFRKIFIPETSE